MHLQESLPKAMLDKLRSDDFQPYLNQKFVITDAGLEPIEIELIEVSDYSYSRQQDTTKRKPFSVVFRGPKQDNEGRLSYLPQRIYRIEHEQMGTFDIFIVPIGPDDVGMRYEAVFS
jgi:hypothetical protein